MYETRCNKALLPSFPSFSWQLHFIKSQFAGQLPQPYQDGSDATKVIPPNMNDMNREEYSRYVSLYTSISSPDLSQESISFHFKL